MAIVIVAVSVCPLEIVGELQVSPEDGVAEADGTTAIRKRYNDGG